MYNERQKSINQKEEMAMSKNSEEKSIVSNIIKSFVNDIVKIEGDFSKSDKSSVETKKKQRDINNKVRSFRRYLGIDSSGNKSKEWGARTILKRIAESRALLRATNLTAPDSERQAKKLAREYKEFSSIILELAKSKDIKRECQAMINSDDTPKDLERVLKKFKLEHPVYYRIASSKPGSKLEAIKIAKKDADKKAVIDKNKVTSKKSLVLSRPLIVKAVKEGLRKDQIFASRMALAVILCTGRRNIEILKVGKFEVVNKNTILFSGQAKKKFGAVAKPYEIPVMHASAQDVVDCLDRLKRTSMCKELKGLSNEAVTERTSKTLSDCARTQLKNDNATFYSARAAYGQEAYKKFIATLSASDKKPSVAGYISELLGHDEDDIMSAKSYEGVTVEAKYTAAMAIADYEEQKKQKRASAPKAKGESISF